MAVVRQHLGDCGFCANLAREAAEVAHYLPYATRYRGAPHGSLQRVLQSVGAARPQTEPGRTPQSLLDWLHMPIFAPVAAAVVLVLGLAGWNMSLMGELSENRRQVATLHNRLGQQTHLLVMVSSGSSVTRPLQGTALAPSAAIRLIMDGETNSAMLMASRLPPPPAGQVYQVWLGRQGARMPACRLTVDEQGD